MRQCIFCGKKFEKLSEEHIFPNIICGRLKSKNLICKDCNSWLGENIDKSLEKAFCKLIYLFGIERERCEGLPVIVQDNEGINYRLKADGTYELADVICNINIDKNNVLELNFESAVSKKTLKNGVGRTLAERKEELLKLNKDYKKLIKDTKEMIDQNWGKLSTQVKESVPEFLNLSFSLGGKDMALAVLKIAFMYLNKEKPDIKIDNDIIIQILKNKQEDVFDRCLFYCRPEILFEEISDEISHFIHIEGANGKIIAYVRLFSLMSYVCVLKEEYQGADFSISYGYKLLSKESFKPKCFPVKNLNNLKQSLNFKANFDIVETNLKRDLCRIRNLYDKVKHNAKRTVILDSIEEFLKNYIGEDFVNTSLFQYILDDFGKPPLFFPNNISKEEKAEIITALSMMVYKRVIVVLNNNIT